MGHFSKVIPVVNGVSRRQSLGAIRRWVTDIKRESICLSVIQSASPWRLCPCCHYLSQRKNHWVNGEPFSRVKKIKDKTKAAWVTQRRHPLCKDYILLVNKFWWAENHLIISHSKSGRHLYTLEINAKHWGMLKKKLFGSVAILT